MNSSSMSAQERKDFLRGYLSHQLGGRKFPFDWLETTDFFTAPASSRFHAAYEGGLFDHSVNVADALITLTNKGITTMWSDPSSPAIIGILHDATKIGLYIPSDSEIGGYRYNPSYSFKSDIHGEDSALKVECHMKLTPEEQACIRWHMGAYEGADSWSDYDKAIKAFPNVLWTHTADMVASKLMEVTP